MLGNQKVQTDRTSPKNTKHVECKKKSKSGTDNNRGNWNHLKIVQKIPEQHTEKARNKGTIENSYIGHYTHTSESANVKVLNI